LNHDFHEVTIFTMMDAPTEIAPIHPSVEQVILGRAGMIKRAIVLIDKS
jgi:hypothetical protein